MISDRSIRHTNIAAVGFFSCKAASFKCFQHLERGTREPWRGEKPFHARSLVPDLRPARISRCNLIPDLRPASVFVSPSFVPVRLRSPTATPTPAQVNRRSLSLSLFPSTSVSLVRPPELSLPSSLSFALSLPLSLCFQKKCEKKCDELIDEFQKVVSES
ncbi:hypothetical protein ACLOJK_008259 [Asimina triloba]